MRCVACDTRLYETGDTDLCLECKRIVRMTTRGVYLEPREGVPVWDIISEVNLSVGQGTGYLPAKRGE